MTLDGEQIRTLQVVFRRSNIRPRMGPQFVTIRTTVQSRDDFALSTILDLVELMRVHDIGFIKKVSAGEERTFFVPIERQVRFLINAQAGFSL